MSFPAKIAYFFHESNVLAGKLITYISKSVTHTRHSWHMYWTGANGFLESATQAGVVSSIYSCRNFILISAQQINMPTKKNIMERVELDRAGGRQNS